MKVSKAQRFEARAKILKALGNSNRLLLLDELSQGEKCVAELTAALELDMSTISKHLSVLKSVGLVHSERRGTQIYYKILAPCVLGFFDCVESVMDAQIQRQIQLAK